MAIKICLDPGHGYKQNLGLRGYYESVGNLHACQLLKAELEKYGFEVYMTRTEENQDPSISTQRGQVAVRNNCQVFLSWHSDANAKPGVRGVTVIRSLKRPESVDLGQQLAAAVSKVMDTPLSPYAGHVQGVWVRSYSAQSPNLDYYAVIRNAVAGSSPVKYAFLIEHGFHTNPQDVEKLDSSASRLRIVQAEAKVLADYFGMQAGTPEPPPPADPPASSGLYRVQVGAFKVKANAESFLKKVKAKGFNALLKEQIGRAHV